MHPYYVLAYYLFTSIDEPHREVANHQAFIQGRDITCRIYLSEEGINGQLSGSLQDVEGYMQWLRSDSRFAEISFKIHLHHEQVFPRQTVKYRKQLVALDVPVDLSLGGEHVSPQRWKEMLDARDEKTLLLDVRNDYEWKIGRFEGAALPDLEKFREFPEYVRQLKEEWDPSQTKVMMYCTGGIRCELYSALMRQEGFENVYQLKGGVIQYGLSEGREHWRGKLFVFDDRLAVSIDGKEGEVISVCVHCGAPSDLYYNCANMDCNELFLSCLACAEQFQGCCSTGCGQAPRVRTYIKEARPKPFRRKGDLRYLCETCGEKV